MDIIPIEAGILQTNAYLVIEPFTKNAMLIDCPDNCAAAVLKMLDSKNAVLDAILLTHTHWDHTAGIKELKEKTNAKVFVHKDDEHRLLEPMKYKIMQLPFKMEPVKPDGYVKEGDNIFCSDLTFETLYTPGHTEGGVCFVEKYRKAVFCGDTIFRESIGRHDLPGGSFDQLMKSIKEKILALPDDFKLFPGHGPHTTVGYEKENNPFVNGLMI